MSDVKNYIEREGDILPNYLDQENGNAPIFPQYIDGEAQSPSNEIVDTVQPAESFTSSNGSNDRTREQRLEALLYDDRAGFLPTTKEEITEAMSLLSFIDTAGGAGRHLNEILLHQRKAETDDPQAAVRSITDDYVHWAKDAQRDHTLLKQLDDELVNPKLSLRVALDGRDHPAFRQLTRHYVIRDLTERQLSETQSIEEYGFDPLKTAKKREGKMTIETDPFLAAEQGSPAWEFIEELIDGINVKTARSLLKVAIEDQKARHNYWIERLKEARTHTVARPIANTALKGFGVE